MQLLSIDSIKAMGFSGFQTVAHYRNNTHLIPAKKGVYLVLRTDGAPPKFLAKGSGGFFKGKDPNVSPEELKQNWVDGAIVAYIGKAGGSDSSATLRKRIAQLLKFGEGKNIGHWGGRLLWQLADHDQLVLAFLPLDSKEPRALEAELIVEFANHYGQRPFANLQG